MTTIFKGTIKKILTPITGVSKENKPWTINQIVLGSGDGTDLFVKVFGPFTNVVGDRVLLECTIASKEFNGKYYTDVITGKSSK